MHFFFINSLLLYYSFFFVELVAMMEENVPNASDESKNQDDSYVRNVKLTPVQREVAEAVGLKVGQTVIVRKRIIKNEQYCEHSYLS